MRYTFLLIITLFVCENVSSHTPPIFNPTHLISHIKGKALDTSILLLDPFLLESMRRLNDSVYYLNPPGTLSLYRISFKNGTFSIKTLKNGKYHGFNFGRYLFIKDSVIYCFGGNGLFNTFHGLIYFESQSKEWFEKEIKGLPDCVGSIKASWIKKDSLFTLYSLNNCSDSIHSFGYIDLNTYKYHEYFQFYSSESESISIDEGGIIYSDLEYFIIRTFSPRKCSYEIFDKDKGELFEIPFLNDKDCVDGKSNVYINNGIIYYRDSIGNIDSAKLYKDRFKVKNYFDLYKSQKRVEYGFTEKRILPIWGIVIITSFLTLISIYGIPLYKRNNNKPEDSLKKILDRLMRYKGEVVSREDLDDIFGISHMNVDSMKVSRSQLIQSVNQTSKIEIRRLRSIEDKRVYNYQII